MNCKICQYSENYCALNINNILSSHSYSDCIKICNSRHLHQICGDKLCNSDIFYHLLPNDEYWPCQYQHCTKNCRNSVYARSLLCDECENLKKKNYCIN